MMPKKGYKQTFKHKTKLGLAHKGIKQSEKWKQNNRIAQQGPRPHTQGKNHWRWMGGYSEQMKRKLEKIEIIAGRKKPNRCDICQVEGRICFDHDHNTGKFRGWLCEHCNVILGFARDDSDLLVRLAEYLDNSKL